MFAYVQTVECGDPTGNLQFGKLTGAARGCHPCVCEYLQSSPTLILASANRLLTRVVATPPEIPLVEDVVIRLTRPGLDIAPVGFVDGRSTE